MSLSNELSHLQLACPRPVPDPVLMEFEVLTKVTWKCELDSIAG